MATKTPRPAKDVKPTGARAKFLQEAKDAKTKRLAAEMRKKAKAQAADKKVRPAKDVKKDGARAKFLKDVKSGDIKAKVATPKPGIGSSVLRGIGRFAGPVGALVSMTSPAGADSDKPSGPLMRGNAPKVGGGPEKRQGSESPSLKREAPKASEFRKKNLEANQKAGKKPVKAPAKAAPKAAEPKKPGFKGNWKGAAPTAMQARGGAKIKRKSFADLFKKD